MAEGNTKGTYNRENDNTSPKYDFSQNPNNVNNIALNPIDIGTRKGKIPMDDILEPTQQDIKRSKLKRKVGQTKYDYSADTDNPAIEALKGFEEEPDIVDRFVDGSVLSIRGSYSPVKAQNTGQNTQPGGLIKDIAHKIKKARHTKEINDIIATEPSIVDRHNTTLSDNAPLFAFQDWTNDPNVDLPPSYTHINVNLQEQEERYGESMRPHKKGNIKEISYKKLPDEVDPSVYPTSTDELNEINSLTASDDTLNTTNEIGTITSANMTNSLDDINLDTSNLSSPQTPNIENNNTNLSF